MATASSASSSVVIPQIFTNTVEGSCTISVPYRPASRIARTVQPAVTAYANPDRYRPAARAQTAADTRPVPRDYGDVVLWQSIDRATGAGVLAMQPVGY